MSILAKVTTKVLVSPSKYVQGPGAVAEIGNHVKLIGKRAFIMGGPTAMRITEDAIRKSLEKEGVEIAAADRNVKECTHEAIKRLSEAGKRSNADVIIGVGGGKAVDTAKAVAFTMGVPSVMVPTQCATNAEPSALSVVYTEKHEFVEYMVHPKNPDLIIIDTDILAKSPPEMLVRGMGDALACKFEGEACRRSSSPNFHGGLATLAGLAFTEVCFENLMTYGFQAKQAMENGVVTPALEKIIESVKLLSGLGWECTGLAAAHAVHNGLTICPGIKGEHGEIVAFGTITQLVLEGRPPEEINKIIEWCHRVGLPTTLKDLNVKKEDVMKAAEKACDPHDTMGNMPFLVTPKMVHDAILAADAMGRAYKSGLKSQ